MHTQEMMYDILSIDIKVDKCILKIPFRTLLPLQQSVKPRCWERPGHYLCTPEPGRPGCVISVEKGVKPVNEGREETRRGLNLVKMSALVYGRPTSAENLSLISSHLCWGISISQTSCYILAGFCCIVSCTYLAILCPRIERSGV